MVANLPLESTARFCDRRLYFRRRLSGRALAVRFTERRVVTSPALRRSSVANRSRRTATGVIGGCHRGDSRRYLEELDTFRGQPRIWVVLTHALRQYREREDLIAYLDTIGTRREGLVVESHAVGRTPLPAEVYLYDLSSATKLARSSAGSFHLTGPTSADPRFGCSEGPHAIIAPDFRCAEPPNTGCTPRRVVVPFNGRG